MRLPDIENAIRPLSRTKKLQLIQAIMRMLHKENASAQDTDMQKYFQPGQDVGFYGPVCEPKIAKQLQELL